jgi:hypothetical protein
MNDLPPQLQQLRIEITTLKRAIETLAALPEAARPLQQQLSEKEQQLAALQAASGLSLYGDVALGRAVNIATHQTMINQGAGITPDRAVLLREYLLGLAGVCKRLEVASTVPLTEAERKKRAGAQIRQQVAEIINPPTLM